MTKLDDQFPTLASESESTRKEKEKIKLEAGSRLFKLKKKYQTLRWKKDKKVIDKYIKYETRILAGRFPRKFDAEAYYEKKY